MGAVLDMNTIRNYLLQVGCKIEYPILVNHFKQHLHNPDPNVQGKIRTQFKDFVNRLAFVSLENNMKFIILRPEFRRPPSIASSPTSTAPNSPMRPIDQNKPAFIDQQQQPPLPPPPLPPTPARSFQPNSPQRTTTAPPPPPPIPQHQTPQREFVKPLPPKSNTQQTTIANQYQRQQQFQAQYQQNQSQHHQQQQQPDAVLLNQRQLMNDAPDGGNQDMPPPPPPPPLATKRTHHQRPESLNLTSSTSQQQSSSMPPPRPPPRRRQSTASLFNSPHCPSPVEKSREIHDLAKKSPGRVKEHALKLNSFTSSTDIHALMPMKQNKLSRDPSISGSLTSALQRNGSHLTNRSRSSHREDESDSSSLQPIDPLRRKWSIEACQCNYNGLLTLLREDPKLASYKDIVNGYTALHWAAKFGNLDIIKLIAGTQGVSANIKSSAGHTPLHVALMFNRQEAADLLIKSYKANLNIRDHSGKKPSQLVK